MKSNVRVINSSNINEEDARSGRVALFVDDKRSPSNKMGSAEILSKEYLQRLGNGISVRIRQRELSHTDSEELAAKVRLR